MDETITQIQQNSTQSSHFTASKIKPKKTIKFVLLITLHLIVISIIGYIIYQNVQLKKQASLAQYDPISSIIPSRLPTLTPTTLSTTDPTENWKTFLQKDVLPISFKYPNNLVVSVRTGKQPIIVIDTKQNVIPEMFDSAIAPIEIMLDLNKNKYTDAVENAKKRFDASSLKVEIMHNNGIVGSLITGTVIPGMRSGRFIEAYFDNGINPAIMFLYEGYSQTYKNTTISEDIFTQIVKSVSYLP